MIVKSIGAKHRNFQRLINYLFKEDRQRVKKGEERSFTFLHNIFSDNPHDRKTIAEAFKENDTYRRKRKNGVSMYHDILSFAPSERKLINDSMLYDIVREYTQLRGMNGLAVGKVHYHEDHIHLHVVLSGTELYSQQPQRMSKEAFREEVVEKIRDYQRRRYPQLKAYDIKRKLNKIAKKSSRKKDTRGKEKRRPPVHRVKLAEEIVACLKGYPSLLTFQKRLAERNITSYTRNGRLTGVLYKKRRYRFSTLLRDYPQEKEKLQKLMREHLQEQQKAKSRERDRERNERLKRASERKKDTDKKRERD